MSDDEYRKMEIERRNKAFMKRLREMDDADLAARLESGGVFIAPNPHYVLEAARRLRGIEGRIRRAVDAAMCQRRVKLTFPADGGQSKGESNGEV